MSLSRFLPAVGLVAMATLVAACGGGSSGEVTLPPDASPQAVAGQTLMSNRSCTSCHTTDGGRSSGPTWKGIVGAQRTLTDGRTVTVDDEYLRRAIAQPDVDVPKGYSAGIMSSAVKGSAQPTPQEIEQMVAYIKAIS